MRALADKHLALILVPDSSINAYVYPTLTPGVGYFAINVNVGMLDSAMTEDEFFAYCKEQMVKYPTCARASRRGRSANARVLHRRCAKQRSLARRWRDHDVTLFADQSFASSSAASSIPSRTSSTASSI